MITYVSVRARLLFVGINPHPGSFARGVPFSNNKTFWYLLSDAGLIDESRLELRDDRALRTMYRTRFNAVYRFGLVNLITRPTRTIAELRNDEELSGRRRVARIIKTQNPKVVCFVGKATYDRYAGRTDTSFGWRHDTEGPRTFVMHSPLRGPAAVRIRELRAVQQAAHA